MGQFIRSVPSGLILASISKNLRTEPDGPTAASATAAGFQQKKARCKQNLSRMLATSQEYLIAKIDSVIGFDTAENEPVEV